MKVLFETSDIFGTGSNQNYFKFDLITSMLYARYVMNNLHVNNHLYSVYNFVILFNSILDIKRIYAITY